MKIYTHLEELILIAIPEFNKHYQANDILEVAQVVINCWMAQKSLGASTGKGAVGGGILGQH